MLRRSRKALAHHVQAIADTDAWRRRTLQKENVDKIFKKVDEVEKHRQSFRDLDRHKKEQKDLWTKAERSVMKLVGMTTIHDVPRRARDMPQFDPQIIGKRDHLIPIGINKDPNIFHPEYTNLYKLDQYVLHIIHLGKITCVNISLHFRKSLISTTVLHLHAQFAFLSYQTCIRKFSFIDF